ncbi:hypothetical protein DACRYDRAFT_20237 [Dacryopinax primogenitus]|uniref:Uncharacterized protein n=1 Tax=Dacryopinax primogenitus (strain DJM 731) TaxID=1858805 RepID=M5GGQ8_DACPD|nr:uncharacterized protein DACRYDRAFT_20237 [Dacryopinax primogenitus]EJU05913.1 hypothetical protein DACRYDRAFT_20237 [Dacryopinax primogenitus]
MNDKGSLSAGGIQDYNDNSPTRGFRIIPRNPHARPDTSAGYEVNYPAEHGGDYFQSGTLPSAQQQHNPWSAPRGADQSFRANPGFPPGAPSFNAAGASPASTGGQFPRSGHSFRFSNHSSSSTTASSSLLMTSSNHTGQPMPSDQPGSATSTTSTMSSPMDPNQPTQVVQQPLLSPQGLGPAGSQAAQVAQAQGRPYHQFQFSSIGLLPPPPAQARAFVQVPPASAPATQEQFRTKAQDQQHLQSPSTMPLDHRQEQASPSAATGSPHRSSPTQRGQLPRQQSSLANVTTLSQPQQRRRKRPLAISPHQTPSQAPQTAPPPQLQQAQPQFPTSLPQRPLAHHHPVSMPNLALAAAAQAQQAELKVNMTALVSPLEEQEMLDYFSLLHGNGPPSAPILPSRSRSNLSISTSSPSDHQGESSSSPLRQGMNLSSHSSHLPLQEQLEVTLQEEYTQGPTQQADTYPLPDLEQLPPQEGHQAYSLIGRLPPHPMASSSVSGHILLQTTMATSQFQMQQTSGHTRPHPPHVRSASFPGHTRPQLEQLAMQARDGEVMMSAQQDNNPFGHIQDLAAYPAPALRDNMGRMMDYMHPQHQPSEGPSVLHSVSHNLQLHLPAHPQQQGQPQQHLQQHLQGFVLPPMSTLDMQMAMGLNLGMSPQMGMGMQMHPNMGMNVNMQHMNFGMGMDPAMFPLPMTPLDPPPEGSPSWISAAQMPDQRAQFMADNQQYLDQIQAGHQMDPQTLSPDQVDPLSMGMQQQQEMAAAYEMQNNQFGQQMFPPEPDLPQTGQRPPPLHLDLPAPHVQFLQQGGFQQSLTSSQHLPLPLSSPVPLHHQQTLAHAIGFHQTLTPSISMGTHAGPLLSPHHLLSLGQPPLGTIQEQEQAPPPPQSLQDYQSQLARFHHHKLPLQLRRLQRSGLRRETVDPN